MSADEPFLLLQLSDTHLGADWQGVDPERCLRQAVAEIAALPQRPDALLVSGDLTQNGTPEEYARVRELLAPLGLAPHVLPGNHDLRGPLREAFGLSGAGAEPVCHAADLGPLRLVCLDSTVPGAEGGALDEGQIGWLEAALAEDRGKPTVVALHHPPLPTGMPGFERIGLAPEARAALATVLGGHPQVALVVAGHVHRAIVGELAGRPVLTVPSTYLQSALDFAAARITMRPDPPGYAVHALQGGALVSHVQSFARFVS
ncbi:MAG TPA: phosphodiesterase [Solirubrobacterales bacterium]|nr:phosphodiesterase [Solirubrobacterales bacterium]